MYMLIASPSQRFVSNSVGLGGIFAFAFPVVLNILLIVAFEPDNLRIALKGEDMRCDAVEKPTIV
jgi:hypothetical protein